MLVSAQRREEPTYRGIDKSTTQKEKESEEAEQTETPRKETYRTRESKDRPATKSRTPDEAYLEQAIQIIAARFPPRARGNQPPGSIP